VIDSHTIELMNLEIDGVLDAGGRERLRALLAADPRAREMFDDLRRLAHLLDTAIAVDPPAGLNAQVLAGVAGSKVVPFAAPLPGKRLLPLKIAAGVAAALVLVFLVRPSVFRDIHVTDLSGTMRRIAANGPVTASVLPSSDSGRTSIRLELADPALRSIELEFDPRQLEMAGVSGKRAAVQAPRAGVVVIEGPQPPGLEVTFRRTVASPARVTIRVNGPESRSPEMNVLLPSAPTK
jgi:hypothetical protein